PPDKRENCASTSPPRDRLPTVAPPRSRSSPPAQKAPPPPFADAYRQNDRFQTPLPRSSLSPTVGPAAVNHRRNSSVKREISQWGFLTEGQKHAHRSNQIGGPRSP